MSAIFTVFDHSQTAFEELVPATTATSVADAKAIISLAVDCTLRSLRPDGIRPEVKNFRPTKYLPFHTTLTWAEPSGAVRCFEYVVEVS